MNFHDFYFGLSAQKRAEYAARVGTTIHYLERVAGGFKMPSLPMAVRFIRAANNKRVTLNSIVQTYEAKHGSIT